MTFQILVFLLLVVLVAVSIPVAVYFMPEAPASQPQRSWFRRRPRVRTLSSQEMTMLKRWYMGKSCVFCTRPIGPIHGEPRPGFLDERTKRSLGWQDMPAAELPGALEEYQPVCASCFTAESFRSRYPDLVVDRTPTPLRDSAMH
jgi:hypothetical protein